MRLNLLTTSLLLSAALGASAAEAPVAKWANLFDGGTSAGDQSEDIAVSSDGSVYWHNMGGSTEAIPDVSYAGTVLFQGAPYNTGNSHSNNLCILKTASDGTLLWNLHSTTADFATNIGGVAATSDGGVVFTGKVRHTEGQSDRDLVIVDGTGESHTFEWTAENRYYRVVTGYIDADGSLKWMKFFDLSTEPSAGATKDFIADAVSVVRPLVDSEGNVYVGGSFSAEMTVPAEGGDVTLVPNNIETWSGDSQSASGSMYIVKLDREGGYLTHIQDSGSATATKLLGLAMEDDAIYLQGSVVGATSELSMGGMTFTAEGEFSPLLARFNTALEAQWIDCFKGERPAPGKSYGYQNTSVTVCGPTLWLTGMFNGIITDPSNPDNTIASRVTPREGFILKIDAYDGSWQKGVNSLDSYASAGLAGTGLTGYMGAIQNPLHPEKVYVYGYVMNATVGVFLRTYDAETLTSDPEEAWTLVSGGGVPTAIGCAYEGYGEQPRLYVSARGNQAFTVGDITTAAPEKWAVLMAGYDLPAADFSTGVETVAMTPADGEAEYYTISGIRLSGVPSAPGVYIRRQGSEATKIVVSGR